MRTVSVKLRPVLALASEALHVEYGTNSVAASPVPTEPTVPTVSVALVVSVVLVALVALDTACVGSTGVTSRSAVTRRHHPQPSWKGASGATAMVTSQPVLSALLLVPAGHAVHVVALAAAEKDPAVQRVHGSAPAASAAAYPGTHTSGPRRLHTKGSGCRHGSSVAVPSDAGRQHSPRAGATGSCWLS